MAELSSELYQRCRETLLKCSQLDSDDRLRAVFAAQELAPFKTGLPEATTKNERIDVILDYLIPRRLSDGRPAFPLFLETLRDRYQPSDALRDELETLAEDVCSAPISPATAPLLTATRHPQLILKLFEMGPDRTHRDRLGFVRSSRERVMERVFGLALENTTEAIPAKGILIRVEFWWEGDMPQKAPSFRSPPHGKWTPRFVNLFSGQEAVLSFKGPDSVCVHKHPEEWGSFKFRLPDAIEGHFRITYTISTLEPITESHGELRIVIKDDAQDT